MAWLKERVWQLGIGFLIAIIAMVLLYQSGTNGFDRTSFWIGLILFFVAIAIPLFARLFEAVQENEGEEGET